MRGIMLAEANAIIEGTFASAARRKAYALAAIVLDAGGRVKAFQKQDGASLMRFEIAYGKAFGALALNRSSRQVLQKAKEKPAFMQSLTELADGPVFLEAGGQLIRDPSGEIVGALGVTGDVNEVDDLCASTASMPAASAPMPISTPRRPSASTSKSTPRWQTRGTGISDQEAGIRNPRFCFPDPASYA
jgi:uncharacterized protein GlcG (DUF336 family)